MWFKSKSLRSIEEKETKISIPVVHVLDEAEQTSIIIHHRDLCFPALITVETSMSASSDFDDVRRANEIFPSATLFEGRRTTLRQNHLVGVSLNELSAAVRASRHFRTSKYICTGSTRVNERFSSCASPYCWRIGRFSRCRVRSQSRFMRDMSISAKSCDAKEKRLSAWKENSIRAWLSHDRNAILRMSRIDNVIFCFWKSTVDMLIESSKIINLLKRNMMPSCFRCRERRSFSAFSITWWSSSSSKKRFYSSFSPIFFSLSASVCMERSSSKISRVCFIHCL